MSVNVRMGVCNVRYGDKELGHTKGGVKLTYKVESENVETDQSDVPVDVVITKQPCEVTVPLVDYQLEMLATLVPDGKLIVDADDASKMRLEIGGKAGASLADTAKPLVITPVKGGANDIVTLYHAVAVPEFELSYEKGTNVHIYNMRFKALAGDNGYIAFGDPDAEDLS